MITKLRKLFATPAFSIFLGLTVLGTCLSSTPAEANPATDQSLRHSGEDLFRGIFLASGYVAEALPEIRDYQASRFIQNQEQLAEIKRKQDLVVAEVARLAPGFFYDLEQTVSGKNPVLIRTKLEQGVALLQTALSRLEMTPDPAKQQEAVQRIQERMTDNSPEALKVAINEEMESAFMAPCVVLILPPVLWQCIVAMCYVVVMYYVGVESFGADQTNLLKDQLVASIATNL